MKTYAAIGGFILSAACAACSSSPVEQPGATVASNDAPSNTAAPQPAMAKGRAYIHDAAKSRFALGAVMREESWHLGTRLVGSAGVLAMTPSGATFAVLDADAKERLLNDGPLTTDPAVHEAHVVDYFVSNGLPQEQIGERAVLTLMTKSGLISESPSSKPGVFRAYTTVLHRVIDGVRVENSFASASFNRSGEVTAESVYWPEVPQATIDEATALKAKLSDRTVHATFKAKTAHAVDYEDGEVVIHHSAATEPALAFYASADFHGHVDLAGGTPTPTTRSFRIDGAEVIPSRVAEQEMPKGVEHR